MCTILKAQTHSPCLCSTVPLTWNARTTVVPHDPNSSPSTPAQAPSFLFLHNPVRQAGTLLSCSVANAPWVSALSSPEKRQAFLRVRTKPNNNKEEWGPGSVCPRPPAKQGRLTALAALPGTILVFSDNVALV